MLQPVHEEEEVDDGVDARGEEHDWLGKTPTRSHDERRPRDERQVLNRKERGRRAAEQREAPSSAAASRASLVQFSRVAFSRIFTLVAFEGNQTSSHPPETVAVTPLLDRDV